MIIYNFIYFISKQSQIREYLFKIKFIFTSLCFFKNVSFQMEWNIIWRYVISVQVNLLIC